MEADVSEDVKPNESTQETGLSRRGFAAVLAAGLAAVAGAPAAEAAELPLTEADVMVKTPDGNCDAAFIHPTTGTYPGVLIWPDAFGLRPAMRLVENDQLTPGALGVRHVVYRHSVLQRHVGYTPAMQACVNFDFGRHIRRGECCLQFVFRVRLPHVIVSGDAEIHARFDLGRQKMRAVGIVGHQAAAVKGRAGADAIGDRRCSFN